MSWTSHKKHTVSSQGHPHWQKIRTKPASRKNSKSPILNKNSVRQLGLHCIPFCPKPHTSKQNSFSMTKLADNNTYFIPSSALCPLICSYLLQLWNTECKWHLWGHQKISMTKLRRCFVICILLVACGFLKISKKLKYIHYESLLKLFNFPKIYSVFC